MTSSHAHKMTSILYFCKQFSLPGHWYTIPGSHSSSDPRLNAVFWLKYWLIKLPCSFLYVQIYFLFISKDLPSCVKAIAEFVENPLTEEVIQRIAHPCSFGEMAKNSASYQVIPESGNISFLRKGEIGDWKNHFTPEMTDFSRK